MARFILKNDYQFLEFCSDFKYDLNSIIVKEMNQNPNGNISYNIPKTSAILHPRKTGSGVNTTYFNQLEIYGVVISGYRLQELILELEALGLIMNRQGLCLVYTSDKAERREDFYPLYDLFNWSKYGVINVPYPPRELWSVMRFPQLDKYNFNSFDNFRVWNPDQSKEIRLKGADLFISCKEGPLLLWKVESPRGQSIRKVRLMGMIEPMVDMSRLEVNGVTVQGGKVQALCRELMGRNVMVNADGWCLFYTGDPTSADRKGRGGCYYRIVFRFDWYKYGVATSGNYFLWGPKGCLDEVKTITELVFPTSANMNERGGNGKKAKEENCDTRLKEKEKELCSCRSKLEQKERELCLCETRLKEKDRELDGYKVQVKEEDLKLCHLEKCLKEKQQELEDCEEKLKKKEKQVCLYELQLEEKEREVDKCLEEKGQELLKCKLQLEEMEKELNCYKKLLKEKNQELHDGKLELEDKEKRIAPLQESSRLVGNQVGRVLSPTRRRNRKSYPFVNHN